MTDFDTLWKFESIRLAAMEQLEIQGELKLELLFQRAKDIYNKGQETSLRKWTSVWNDENMQDHHEALQESHDIEAKNSEKIREEAKDQNSKVCPKCNELCEVGWTKHKYKKDGTECGYEW